jgi:hypothetical protein
MVWILKWEIICTYAQCNTIPSHTEPNFNYENTTNEQVASIVVVYSWDFYNTLLTCWTSNDIYVRFVLSMKSEGFLHSCCNHRHEFIDCLFIFSMRSEIIQRNGLALQKWFHVSSSVQCSITINISMQSQLVKDLILSLIKNPELLVDFVVVQALLMFLIWYRAEFTYLSPLWHFSVMLSNTTSERIWV